MGYLPPIKITKTRVSNKGNQTILLVEDETELLSLGRETLEQMGYTVLAADSPRKALGLAAGYPGEIQLLMTDVIMPEMNGLELANKLIREHPGIRCLYVSGYTTDIFSSHGVSGDEVHFLQKPFTKKSWNTCFKNFVLIFMFNGYYTGLFSSNNRKNCCSGIGHPKRYPWTMSHPNFSKSFVCASSSTPSAITCKPKLWAMSMIVLTITASLGLTRICLMKEMSIFT